MHTHTPIKRAAFPAARSHRVAHDILKVLNRVADGEEILYQHNGRAFFHQRRGGSVNKSLAERMIAAGLLQPDLDLTDKTRGVPAMPPVLAPIASRPTISAAFVRRDLNGPDCILWSGALCGNGYPRSTFDGVWIMLYKFIYERHYGPLPVGVRLKNECGHRNCINPSHWRDSIGLRDRPNDPRAIYARIMRAPTVEDALREITSATAHAATVVEGEHERARRTASRSAVRRAAGFR